MAVSLLAGSVEYTLVSGPDGPLTRRYAPTSGKPSSGPLRPRTEALSWLKAGMVWQGWGWDRRNLSIGTGLRRASAVLLRYHMKQWSSAFHAADAASKTLSSPVISVLNVYFHLLMKFDICAIFPLWCILFFRRL